MEPSNVQEIMTTRDILKVIFKNKIVILTTFMVTMLTVYIGFSLKTPVFEAQVKMLVTAKKQIESMYYRDLVDFRQADIAVTQSEIVKSLPVLETTVETLDLTARPADYERQFASGIKTALSDFSAQAKKLFMNVYYMFKSRPAAAPESPEIKMIRTVNDLKENIEVEAIKDTDIFIIKVTDFNPVAAATIANVVSRAYIIFDLQQQLTEMQLKFGDKHQAVTQVRETIEKMKSNLTGEKLPTVEAIGPASVKVIDQANIPLSPKGKPRLFYYLISAVLGVVLGIILAFLFEHFDQAFKSPQELEHLLGAPLLGYLPVHHGKFSGSLDRMSPAMTGALASLSDQIFMQAKDVKAKTILFSTSRWQTADSAVIALLGEYMSQKMGLKVLLVDADLRTPELHQLYHLQGDKGLSNVIEGTANLKDSAYAVNKKLSILPAGQAVSNPLILLGSKELEKILEQAQGAYDLVLVRGTAMCHVKDVTLLGELIGNLVLIVNEQHSRRQSLKALFHPLREQDINLLGVVLNERRFSIPQIIYDRV